MTLEKPASIAESPFKSAKWDEITAGRDFGKSDVPTIELLCQWYEIAAQCMEDMTRGDGGVQVAYSNDMGDIKALPQIATMKQASAEIRALNKQLGISDGADAPGKEKAGGSAVTLTLIGRRAQRKSEAAG